MNYISVKEAANKFNLSERRVQRLCETNRIDGCRMISGVWLIPENAQKPSDERSSSSPDSEHFLTLKETCEILSISTATGRNWVRLGKLSPEHIDGKKVFFSKEYIFNLKRELQSGENRALKSRRNKKYISGNSLYSSYVSENCKNITVIQNILTILSTKNIELNSNSIQYLIAECALHLFVDKNSISISNCNIFIKHFLNNDLSVGEYDELIEDLIDDSQEAIEFCDYYHELFKFDYIYETNEDVLGLLYISCANQGERKAKGSYYTANSVVNEMIDKLNIDPDDRILDPCCGTGNFLLQLPQTVSFDAVYGNDIDPIGIKIARLNMALKYEVSTVLIREHITELNFLTEYGKSHFNYIIGNPPWGYDFSDREKLQLCQNFQCAIGKNVESYDVFVEQSLKHLATKGHLVFVLPEAILNVKAHISIRKVILDTCNIKSIDFLGNAFNGVQCPCIVLDLQFNDAPLSTIGMQIKNSNTTFVVNTDRKVAPDYFSFTMTDEEYCVLKKIKNVKNAEYLAGNADFALGIVTGNNKKYISNNKTASNEMILKGADIRKYHITQTNNYIFFEPDSFQQIAPTELYRAQEKLLYRFISSQLVFAYDNQKTLSLNSCNIVIPKLNGIDIKYVLAVLNSRIAQYIYKMEFNSVKVLRSYIESIPIPHVDEDLQQKIIALTDLLISGLPLDKAEEIYDKLDTHISSIFNLTIDEYNTIKNSVDGENKFLV